jgi:putative ABC transport system permease protein
MMLLKYSFRNLLVRRGTTMLTTVTIGLVVWASVLTFGLADGLKQALLISGEPLDLIVLRKGSQDEVSSSIERQVAAELATLEGIARDPSGQPLCSVEFVTILTKPRRNQGGTTNLIVRGLNEVGRKMRPDFQIAAGRDLTPGRNEAITSRRMAERFENCAIGEKLTINEVPFDVVGYFEAGGSAAESEVWTALADVTAARRTQGAISSANLRARDANAKETLTRRIQEDEQFNLKVVDEKKYYEDQMTAAIAIQVAGSFIAVFLSVGACFAAANTMYGAVASRAREIGTLRALGFRRHTILATFILESVAICLAGGVLGCLGTLPFNGLSTGTANWATFSEITFAFQFGPNVLLRGILMALVMGTLGGMFPAARAVRLDIIKALREL